MTGEKAASLADIVSVPENMKEINKNVLWSASVKNLAELASHVKSAEVKISEGNRWLIIELTTAVLGIPQNGIKNPQELVGKEVVYLIDYFTRAYTIYQNGPSIFYTTNVAMIRVGGEIAYINPAYEEFLNMDSPEKHSKF